MEEKVSPKGGISRLPYIPDLTQIVKGGKIPS
jgi:hypothetical protein